MKKNKPINHIIQIMQNMQININIFKRERVYLNAYRTS